MKIKPHQIQQFANQKQRIGGAGVYAYFMLWHPWRSTIKGTFYSERFQKYNHLGI